MMNLSQIATVTGARLEGPLLGEGEKIFGVTTDSRADCTGKMFVALTGPRFDGHHYVESAHKNGAIAAMLQRGSDVNIPMLLVEDTLASLGQTAASWRSQLEIPVVGVTGSVGKTTVKELLGSILTRLGEGILTEGNLNNEIGVPLTLTRLESHHTFAVIEMGMNQAGEISRLSRMSRPTIAVINNAAAAHLELLGTVEAVAAAKAEILEGLVEDGVVILNADDDSFEYWKDLSGDHRVISFGLDQPADITARYTLEGDHAEMLVNLGGAEEHIQLPLPGRHNVSNALAAIAAASALNISSQDIKHGLENSHGFSNRLGIVKHGAVTVIDDTYNANPASMRAAIEVLADYPGDRHILVMGDMAELGESARQSHEEIVKFACDHGVDLLYTYGPRSLEAAVAFSDRPGGQFSDKNQLARDLIGTVRDGDVVLVKGSRSMFMEEVVELMAEALDDLPTKTGMPGGTENAA
jgi:UDP-N-acetylmuramoyl-tripeptide--D-alanyl-D-alanine ligase